MTCRGGDSCCTREKPCDDGLGDCDQDHDCKTNLVCGHQNCGKWGGLWDWKDDCCERRCTSTHPCTHGDGHCTYNSDCERDGYHVCHSSVSYANSVPLAIVFSRACALVQSLIQNISRTTHLLNTLQQLAVVLARKDMLLIIIGFLEVFLL